MLSSLRRTYLWQEGSAHSLLSAPRSVPTHIEKMAKCSYLPISTDINDPAPPPVTSVLDEDVKLIALQRERRRMDGKLDGTNGFLNLLTNLLQI
jgi:hypothetical protein